MIKMFVVTNGTNYLKTNTKLTTKINEAKKFPNYTLAEKSKAGMKRTFKKMGVWSIQEFIEPVQREDNDIYDRDVYYNKDKITTIMSVDTTMNKSFALAENISEAYKKMLSYKSLLETTIADKEKETQDILHFIEFYDLDAYNGYMVYKTLQDIRIERRNAKNELERVNTFLKYGMDSADMTISNTEKKSYTPRILFDLFRKKWKAHKERKIKNEKD